MDRSEIMELRRLFKTYKETGCPVNGFSRGFLDADGSVRTCDAIQHFHDLRNNDVKKRIFTLVAKTISNNAITLPIKPEARGLFEKINAEKGKNCELFAELCDRISSAIKESGVGNTYAVHLLSYTYDPPAKTKDHKTIIDGVSDEIYTFFVAMILPVKTSKPSYGYFSDEKVFAMNPLQRIVDSPVCGFVYPDFTDRTSDFDSVLYFRTEKMDISKALFGEEAPELVKKETVKLSLSNPVKVENTEGNSAGDVEASVISSDVVAVREIASLDSGSLSMEEVRGRDIAAEKHSDDAAKELAEVRHNDGKTETEPYVSTQKSNKKVRITGNTKNLKRQLVDGVMCILVPVSEAEVG